MSEQEVAFVVTKLVESARRSSDIVSRVTGRDTCSGLSM